MRIQGLTYGPIVPSAQGQPFPAPTHVRDDLARMQSLGANSIRTYHFPPDWLPDLGDDSGMTILMDIPWSTHVCTIGTRAGTQSRTGHSA
jgi:beta-galactosidase/beta-glucuronidase